VRLDRTWAKELIISARPNVMPVVLLGSTDQELRRAQSSEKGNLPNAMVKARREWIIALTTGALNCPNSGFSSS